MKNKMELNKETLSKVSGGGYEHLIIAIPDGYNIESEKPERNTEGGFWLNEIYTNW